MSTALRTIAAAGIAALFASPAAHGAGINWASVPGKEVVLFYPGQSSWEWALTTNDMSGAEDFRKGKNCSTCHIGEEKDMGPQIVSGKPRVFKTGEKPSIEPTPIPGKPGTILATVKVANDGTNLYVHLDVNEGAQPDARQDPAYATKVTVMFDNGKVSEANRGGCWAACHDDLTNMPSAQGATRTMYLRRTRAKLTRQGGGDALVAPDQLAKLRADGYQLEYLAGPAQSRAAGQGGDPTGVRQAGCGRPLDRDGRGDAVGRHIVGDAEPPAECEPALQQHRAWQHLSHRLRHPLRPCRAPLPLCLLRANAGAEQRQC